MKRDDIYHFNFNKKAKTLYLFLLQDDVIEIVKFYSTLIGSICVSVLGVGGGGFVVFKVVVKPLRQKRNQRNQQQQQNQNEQIQMQQHKPQQQIQQLQHQSSEVTSTTSTQNQDQMSTLTTVSSYSYLIRDGRYVCASCSKDYQNLKNLDNHKCKKLNSVVNGALSKLINENDDSD